MNEVLAFPIITKRRPNNSSPARSIKGESFRSSYLHHLYEHRQSKSPMRDSIKNLSPNVIKRPKQLPPITKPNHEKLFENPIIQEKYEEIKGLYRLSN